MTEDEFTNSSGMLGVGNGHKVWYMDWGNPKVSEPIFWLHGGPGAGSNDKYKSYFDPQKHHVIFHDQRGCGKSVPFGELLDNTTSNLIDDIEKLRTHLKFSSIKIIGGSWGSTLGLAYAIKHSKNVSALLLWGIYTGTKTETEYISQGGMSSHFPDSWQQYIEVVPQNRRHETIKYYMEQMTGSDPAAQIEHVRRWCLLESSAMSIDSDFRADQISLQDVDDSARALAILEGHYFLNDCFMPDQYILKNANKLTGTPIVMVQGRFDHVCPPETAYKLAAAIGKNCHLHIVPASHGREGSLREAVRAYAWSFLG